MPRSARPNISPTARRGRAALTAVIAVAALGLGLAAPSAGVSATIESPPPPTALTVQQRTGPVDLDVAGGARLGWQTERTQTAYQVRVAAHADPAGDDDVLWDSGRVDAPSSVGVPYGGEPIEAAARYWWTVRTWDAAGTVSEWAEPATFGTGPGATWEDAETIWVGNPDVWGSDYTLEFRAQFTERHVTVAFRAQDSGNYYLWQLRGNGADELATHVRTNNDPNPPVSKTVPLGVEIENGPDARYYDVKLEVVGDTIRTYLDGVLIDTTRDATFSAGGFGFRTGGSESFTVDDVRMTSTTGEVVYANNFSDTGAHNDFRCGTVAGGVLTIPRGQGAGCLYYGPWSDYNLEVDVTVAERATGVVLRARDGQNYLMWQVRGDTSTIVPHTRANGQFAALPASAPVQPAIGVGTTNRLRIEARGNTIRTFINGTLVDDREIAGFPSGGVGFRNGGSEQGVFANLEVTTPDGELVYRNDFPDGDTEFACGTVVDGTLRVGRSGDCVMSSLPGGVNNWAFLRGEAVAKDKEVTWATVYASGSDTLPGYQYVYRMWVNGEFVGLGPTQPMAGENRYDGYDVTHLIRQGEANAVGLLAHTTREHQIMAQLVIGYADGTRQILGTGDAWTTMPGGDVYPEAGSIGTSYYRAPVENLRAAHYPFGFAEPGFDDSEWWRPVVKAPMESLVATPTEKVTERLESPARIVEKGAGHYFIDFGRTWVGGVRLELEGQGGERVDIRYGEELTDAATSANTVRWQLRTGNTYRDIYELASGEQTLQNWGMRSFRYVEILGSPEAITTENLHAAALIYPFDTDAARFQADSTDLESVWQLSKNTIEALNVNLYVDTWTRERINYEADSFIQLQSHIYLDPDPTLAEYSMEYLLTRRTWPTEWPMYVILGMHELWQSTGDTALLERSYEQLQGKLPERYLEESTGLIRKTSGSDGGNSKTDDDIVDWPAGERDGYQFRQYNTVVNALAYKSYRDMADIAEVTGHADDAARYRAIADRMRDAINEHLYDPEKGAYRDGMDADHVPTEHWALHASVWPQAFGVTPEDQRERVGEYLATRGMACSVYCAPFLLQALYDGNQGDAAYGLLTSTGLRSWLNMIAQGAGATMEAWDTSLKANTSFSHPWASSPAFMIPRGMFGIQSAEPGYRVFSVKPQPGGLTTAQVTVPTIRGQIAAAFEVVGDDVDLAVRVPAGSEADISVPLGRATGNVVFVDGRPMEATNDGAYLTVEGVPAGCHVITVAGDRLPGVDGGLADVCSGGLEVEPDAVLTVMSAALEGHVDGGAVAGPIAHQLGKAIEQAQSHYAGGRLVAAIRAVERVITHLDNPKRPDTLDADARDDLRALAIFVLGRLE